MHHPTPAPHTDTPDRFLSHPVPVPDSAADQGTSPTSPPDPSDSTDPSLPPIDIALINAVAFQRAIKEPRAVQFSLQLRAAAQLVL